MSSVSESGGGAGTGGASSDRTSSGPVLLVTLYDPVEAEIIMAKLESADIAAYRRHDAMSVVYGLTVDGFGRQDIMVRAEDLFEARAALEQEL